MNFKNKIFFDKDVSLDELKYKKVGIIGYGNQGRAQALNLNESGIDVVVGLRENSNTKLMAEKDGLKSALIEDLVSSCDLISILIPDSQIPRLFKRISSLLKKKQTLLFSHGYVIVNNEIEVPDYINIIMVAPSGGGAVVRSEYKKGFGVPALIAIEQDFSSNSLDLALSYSKAIGSTKAAVFLSTFKEEFETDLFGEQVVLTGSIPMIIMESYKLLVSKGYSPIVSWFVCFYETKTIIDLMFKNGMQNFYESISDTARFGGVSRGSKLIDQSFKNKMEDILEEIQNGVFDKELKKSVSNNINYKSNEVFDSKEFNEIENLLLNKMKD